MKTSGRISNKKYEAVDEPEFIHYTVYYIKRMLPPGKVTFFYSCPNKFDYKPEIAFSRHD